MILTMTMSMMMTDYDNGDDYDDDDDDDDDDTDDDDDDQAFTGHKQCRGLRSLNTSPWSYNAQVHHKNITSRPSS